MGLGRLLPRIFEMSFWSSFGIFLGLLLLFWEALFHLRFASRFTTWRLPVDGHVIGRVSDDYGGMLWF